MEKTVKLPTVRATLGLLTTVHQLPTNFQVQYIKIKPESPLDLTIKPVSEYIKSAMTPPNSMSPIKKRYRNEHDDSFTIDEDHHRKDAQSKTILSPLKKRYRDDNQNDTKIVSPSHQIKNENTPKKVLTQTSSNNHKASKIYPKTSVKEKKSKAIRKLKFDEFRSSPVSGTIIRTLEEMDENNIQESGDIQEEYNIVEVTDEAKAELAQIRNFIGAYICKLCKIEFDDAFGLARHRCNCIVLLEYRCPECQKRFNCPANLASHRRWHKPRDQINKKSTESSGNEAYSCKICGKNFKRQAYLNKHKHTHSTENNKKSTNNKNLQQSALLHHESSVNLFTANSHDSNHDHDVLIPQTVFTFNRTTSATPSDTSSEHELVINENSNSSINSVVSTASENFNIITSHFTEDENIAISALTNLRNGASVIRHTYHTLTV